jgi:tRNA(Ile)-lysidine synthase
MERLGPVDRVAVGVSGGADSMALLHLLCAWNTSAAQKLELTAVTVDHGLRAQSRQEAEAVAAWAKHLGVAHKILVWTGSKPVSNIEAIAREARYRLMGQWCRSADIKILMTAHHMDDQAETFLMRLARGSGVSGLAAMAPERPLGPEFPGLSLQRPLLGIPKDDLIALLREIDQPWFEDPSNDSEEFMRSRLRGMREVFGALGLGPDRLVSTAQRMAEASVVLEKVAQELWHEAVQATPYGEIRLNREKVLAAQADTRRRVLARALKGVSGSPFAPRYERLLRLEDAIASGEIGNGVTLHGCKVRRQEGVLSIIREVGRAEAAALPAAGPGLWDGRFQIEWTERVEGAQIRALGEEGLLRLRADGRAGPKGTPGRDILLTLPAAWLGSELLGTALPGDETGLFKARFMLFT